MTAITETEDQPTYSRGRHYKGTLALRREAENVRDVIYAYLAGKHAEWLKGQEITKFNKLPQIAIKTRYYNPKSWGETEANAVMDLINTRHGHRTADELEEVLREVYAYLVEPLKDEHGNLVLDADGEPVSVHDVVALPIHIAKKGEIARLNLRINPAYADHLDALAGEGWEARFEREEQLRAPKPAKGDADPTPRLRRKGPTSPPQTAGLDTAAPTLAVSDDVLPATTPPRELFTVEEPATPEQVAEMNAQLGYNPAPVMPLGRKPWSGFQPDNFSL